MVVLNALPVIGWIVLAVVMIKAGPTRLVNIVTTERATMVLSNKGRLKPAAVLFRGPREPLGDPFGL